MPSGRPAAKAADESKPKSKNALKPIPIGSVYGFFFPFGGTTTINHPGIVIISKVGLRDGEEQIGVIALAITHSEKKVSWKNRSSLLVPEEEKGVMGLDARRQWVCLFETARAYFPDDIKTIKSVGSSYLGQASKAFTLDVLDAWVDYKNS